MMTSYNRRIIGECTMSQLSRRRFFGSVAAALASSRLVRADVRRPRTLRFNHTHTGERLTVAYFQDGVYDPEALRTVNHFLRDFRTNDIHDIDAGLLDLLHTLAVVTETGRPFDVISAYRSPRTNAMLRQHSEGVAAGSLHMRGQAIDIRLDDVALPALRAAALDLKGGGVGYYPASNFVHVDVGRVRFW
jgi:uncharacterized protein YcbK (DUF882 family)